MHIGEGQIFNLMDTNGRRSDVLNALKIYLDTLVELKTEYPTESWAAYPKSTAQFLFYRKVLGKSKDVFKVHKKYDIFMNVLGEHYEDFLAKDRRWIEKNLSSVEKLLDEGIEKRARHYTSNLVKIGFSDEQRTITECGYAYLNGFVHRDPIEALLPLDSVNLILLRQLSKLKVFSRPDKDGSRKFYAPFLMALTLLLEEEPIDRDTFAVIVQGLSPYSDTSLKKSVRQNQIDRKSLEQTIQTMETSVPEALAGKSDLSFDLFKTYFKSAKKSEATAQKYYDFFKALKNFRAHPCEETYKALLYCFERDSNILHKAFGYGKAVFHMGNRGRRYDLKVFLEKNRNHHLLTAADYVGEFYTTFLNSKRIDSIKEYSDTTIRLLSATGLFRFEKMPELAYKEVLTVLFDCEKLRQGIFGEMSEKEYSDYEVRKNGEFGQNTPLTAVFQYTQEETDRMVAHIKLRMKAGSAEGVKELLRKNNKDRFLKYIRQKYPKEKVMELLPMFSDRKKDAQIRREVNDAATVPTIYEYIVGIAWYYISGEDFDLYDSLNLTLSADFEPVIHAAGGAGDIVISYEDRVIMLEVTLMNKQAQKRSEWEPVLRHALNLKADNQPKEVMTFFIADELDYNTVNIWRAVAAAPLEATSGHKSVNGVVIMPFTNAQILKFLEQQIPHTKIIEKVRESFAKVPQITNVEWHEEILNRLLQ